MRKPSRGAAQHSGGRLFENMARWLLCCAAVAAAAARVVEDGASRRAASGLAGLNGTWLRDAMDDGSRFVVRGASYGSTAAARSSLLETLTRPFHDKWFEPHASLRGDGGARPAAPSLAAVAAPRLSAVLRLETLGRGAADAAAAAAAAAAALLPPGVFDGGGDTARVCVSAPGARTTRT
ncbi:calcium ion binding protein [Aureococcus anophagefferens]|nr:calcium ion binding protein [Aureococcus anophagefferens]